jgi:hypothetical protein
MATPNVRPADPHAERGLPRKSLSSEVNLSYRNSCRTHAFLIYIQLTELGERAVSDDGYEEALAVWKPELWEETWTEWFFERFSRWREIHGSRKRDDPSDIWPLPLSASMPEARRGPSRHRDDCRASH